MELKVRNIGASVHFIPLHLHSYYKKRNLLENFPAANKVFAEIISIPMFSAMTDEDVDYVINALNGIVGG
jgi:dTDP-4-amino-4,6-dideoxygalactose transaminase